MRRQRTPRYPFLSDTPHAARTRQPVSKVNDRHSLFGGIYRPCVGNSPISTGFGGVSWVRVVVFCFQRASPFKLWLVCSSGPWELRRDCPVSVKKGQKRQSLTGLPTITVTYVRTLSLRLARETSPSSRKVQRSVRTDQLPMPSPHAALLSTVFTRCFARS